ncbi:hypothetical protein ACFHW2_43400 [Actinomadura sp. LOL_016]|uniref:hypothetical protein n=1 Tax=unclassified Actinomadura TaxID=2626254 RepID=UPI003A7F9784
MPISAPMMVWWARRRVLGPTGPKRRVFSPEYKLAVVEEWERLTESGARGALLRREGLYYSHIQD